MDLLLILTYVAICVVIFKIFRIPLNKWTVPTAVLGGVLLIGALLLLMNYNHPYSESFRQYYVTSPVIPQVRGHVLEVPVQPNTPVKKGEVLFRIDPTPFEERVASIEARLVAARKDLTRAEDLVRRQLAAARTLDEARSQVDDLTAQLDEAQFNLENTVVTAPSDGYVSQLLLRPGMMVVPFPVNPPLSFVHLDDSAFIGWFRQEYLLRLQKGDTAEVIFDGIPGAIFSGEVEGVLPAISEGQMQPTAGFIAYNPAQRAGRIAVRINITDPKFAQYRAELPGGAYGQAAIYTAHFHHVGIIRKVLLRMASWMNYVFPLH